MNGDLPLAYFITWTVYGTHLQGSASGWRKYGRGPQEPQPRLEAWRAERLLYPIERLDRISRRIVKAAIIEHCLHRSWHLWIANPRSTHVHVVLSSKRHRGSVVRDQLKANCTRALREHHHQFRNRPIWTAGGDWECINTEEDLYRVIAYVRDCQDIRRCDQWRKSYCRRHFDLVRKIADLRRRKPKA